MKTLERIDARFTVDGSAYIVENHYDHDAILADAIQQAIAWAEGEPNFASFEIVDVRKADDTTFDFVLEVEVKSLGASL